MRAILSDANIIGQVRRLIDYLENSEWNEYWESLGLAVLTFADVGLGVNSPDSVIWQTCQREQLVLITANRNEDRPDSLEAIIRSANAPDCLPVLTLSDADAVLTGRSYLERVAVRMLERLTDMDYLRGTGRLYLP